MSEGGSGWELAHGRTKGTESVGSKISCLGSLGLKGKCSLFFFPSSILFVLYHIDTSALITFDAMIYILLF